MQITNYFEVGRVGIEHCLLPEKGLVAPGEIIVVPTLTPVLMEH